MTTTISKLERRNFLKTSLAGATGLLIGFYLPRQRTCRGRAPWRIGWRAECLDTRWY